MTSDEPPQRHHCVISGTGRAGTTFLVQLLTHLGLDTGFTVDDLPIYEHARAGLETDIRDEGAPYIVKSPWFCDYADEVFARHDIVVDRLFVPMRDVFAAAESRRFVVREYAARLPADARASLRGSNVAGGLWHTDEGDEQESVLLEQFHGLMLAAAATDIPVTLLQFPRLARDVSYLFAKLSPLLSDVDRSEFERTFARVAKPELVHDFQQ